VFGGEKRIPYVENDRPMPLQVYGITRLAGECAALSEAPQSAFVIRTCGLYGRSGAASKGGNFVDKRIAEGRVHKSIEMSSDQTVSPTCTFDLSRAVFRLVGHPRANAGIYHLVNGGECSWYQFTLAIFEIAGLSCKVVPVDRGGRTGEMRRPLYSAIANTKASALGIELADWKDALRRYIAEKYSSEAPTTTGRA
jgi:dTDP-4-dehydrorhamnose reductase